MGVELVRAARDGDEAAFERLAAAAIDRLYAIAYRVLRDRASAEDAVQDCLVRAWRDLRALRDPSRWEAWLYRLLLNACRDEQRRSMRRPLTVESSLVEPSAGGDTVAEIDLRDELERGFARLSVEHRMALALHFFGGLRPSEVALVLGVPEGTVSSRIHYGTRALRAVLDADSRIAPRTVGGAE